MLGGFHLRERARFGRVRLVATAAQGNNGRKLRLGGGGVFDVRGLRAMASLAGDVGVPAGGAGLRLIRVALQAGALPGKVDRTGGDFLYGSRSIVSITAKGRRNQESLNDEENDESSRDCGGEPNEMAGVSEPGLHGTLPSCGVARAITGPYDRNIIKLSVTGRM